jgi:hypothetical protein
MYQESLSQFSFFQAQRTREPNFCLGGFLVSLFVSIRSTHDCSLSDTAAMRGAGAAAAAGVVASHRCEPRFAVHIALSPSASCCSL